MEPISILSAVSAAGSASKLIFECGWKLYNFIKSGMVVDEVLTALYNEVQSLQKMVDSLYQMLNNPSIKSHETLPLWGDIEEYLAQCHTTVDALTRKITGIQNTRLGEVKLLGRAAKQTKLNMQDDEMKGMRSRIHTHTTEIQMALMMIVVHINCITANISSVTPAIVIESLTPRLDALMYMMQQSHQRDMPSGPDNSKLDQSRQRLQKTAKAIADDARTVIMGSKSTVNGGSQPDLEPTDRPKSTGMPFRTRQTIFSDLGEPLPADARRRISTWIPVEYGDSTGVLEEFHISDSHSLTDTTTSGTNPVSTDNTDFDGESFDTKMALNFLSKGQQKYNEGDYAKAETLLQKALKKFQSSGKTINNTEPMDISLQIAQALFKQQKNPEAQDLCDIILDESPRSDADRKRLLEASYLSSQIHLSNGALEAAERHCRQTLTGRMRIDGKSDAYHESLALMATICEARNEEDEAEFYLNELPDSFVKPEFRHPIVPEVTAKPKTEQSTEESCDTARHKPSMPLTASALHKLHATYKSPTVEDDNSEGPSTERPRDFRDGPSLPDLVLGNPGNAQPKPSVPASPPQPPVIEEPRVENLRERLPHTMSTNNLPQSKSRVVSPPLSNEGGRPVTEPLRSASDVLSDTMPEQMMGPSSSNFAQPDLDRVTRLPVIPIMPTVKKALFPQEAEEAVRILPRYGIDPSDKRFDQTAAMFTAAQHGEELVVRMLLQGWIQEVKKSFRFTSKKLVEKKPMYVDIVDDNDYSPLMFAAFYGQARIVQILLEHGASPHKRKPCLCETPCTDPACMYGQTAMELAIILDHSEVIKVFIAKAVDIEAKNKTGCTALMYAAREGRRNICLWLLSGGADPRATTNAGHSVLHFAAANGQIHLIDLFIEFGVAVDVLDNDQRTPLSEAVANGQYGAAEKLIRYGASLTSGDINHVTPLLEAAKEGFDEFIGLLLDNGADVEEYCDEGLTPLLWAARFGRKPFVKQILNKNADPFAVSEEGRGAVHWAASENHADMITFLRAECGLGLDEQDDDGRTPLFLAAQNGQLAAVETLLYCGVDTELRDDGGESALDFAIKGETEEHTLIVSLLEQSSLGLGTYRPLPPMQSRMPGQQPPPYSHPQAPYQTPFPGSGMPPYSLPTLQTQPPPVQSHYAGTGAGGAHGFPRQASNSSNPYDPIGLY